MSWLRKFRVVGLALLLAFGVSCSTTDNTPTDDPVSQPVLQPSQSLGTVLGGVVGDVGNVVDGTVGNVVDGTVGVVGGVVDATLELTGLLSCEEQKYDVTEKTVGPSGGLIKVGKHVLKIPEGALSHKVRIKAEQMPGSTNSVRFSPQGLRFEKPAALTIDYKNCENIEVPKTIVYTTEDLDILEVLESFDLLKKRSITAPIDHFSRYAVAY